MGTLPKYTSVKEFYLLSESKMTYSRLAGKRGGNKKPFVEFLEKKTGIIIEF